MSGLQRLLQVLNLLEVLLPGCFQPIQLCDRSWALSSSYVAHASRHHHTLKSFLCKHFIKVRHIALMKSLKFDVTNRHYSIFEHILVVITLHRNKIYFYVIYTEWK